MIRRRISFPEGQPGPLGQLVAFVAGAILLVLGFMFSVVLLAVVAAVGLCVWLYLWWKTRELRRVLREQQDAPRSAAFGAAEGQVIEGEVIVVEEHDIPSPRDRR